MPRTSVRFFRESDDAVPVRDWLRELRRVDARGHAKCVARLERLAELGYELRRPEADYLRDGIYELRALRGHVNYRILFFFAGTNTAVLAHALTKQAAVPDADIARALRRKRAFEGDPINHTADA